MFKGVQLVNHVFVIAKSLLPEVLGQVAAYFTHSTYRALSLVVLVQMLTNSGAVSLFLPLGSI